MKKFFSLIAVALVAFAAQATEWTAADGNENVEYAPVYGYNFETDQHNQMQYPAAELTGLAAGTEITALKFYTSTISLVNELGGTVVVSLANIDDVTPWSPDAWGGISGDLLDVAVTAVATVTPAADEDGVWTITFNAPFTYTGNALLIDVQSVAGDYQDTEFYAKEMGSYLIMSTYGYAGSTKGDTKLPKATFVYDGGQGGETTEVALLSEANALEDNVEFTFNGNAVVTLQHGDFLFVRDESGFGQIRGARVGMPPRLAMTVGYGIPTLQASSPAVRPMPSWLHPSCSPAPLMTACSTPMSASRISNPLVALSHCPLAFIPCLMARQLLGAKSCGASMLTQVEFLTMSMVLLSRVATAH